ncbi:uncharacterized protein LAESUDRAFT_59642 [Laetiporus sulphureus 93-53]|uniref:Uncharacterized protein n=1 Tax=Laetiporus sulphureus 93-53 TaxID=1314785 RepID=A0A165AY06_9APHY|nr:uncharacterized protein LAESUDRAFT_59642 [Laetiporus sulphureus 93-53]KZS99872.1 hypothetical protein LAESUDRAFT_59642 [Laetiporus sulphureus 93-53]
MAVAPVCIPHPCTAAAPGRVLRTVSRSPLRTAPCSVLASLLATHRTSILPISCTPAVIALSTGFSRSSPAASRLPSLDRRSSRHRALEKHPLRSSRIRLRTLLQIRRSPSPVHRYHRPRALPNTSLRSPALLERHRLLPRPHRSSEFPRARCTREGVPLSRSRGAAAQDHPASSRPQCLGSCVSRRTRVYTLTFQTPSLSFDHPRALCRPRGSAHEPTLSRPPSVLAGTNRR